MSGSRKNKRRCYEKIKLETQILKDAQGTKWQRQKRDGVLGRDERWTFGGKEGSRRFCLEC